MTTPTVPERSRTRLTRVMIADDDAEVQAALIDLIGDDGTVELVGAVQDAESAVRLAVAQQPDIAVLDVRMPGGGAHATSEIRRLCPHTTVIALSSYGDRRTVGEMLRAGASRFLVKGAPESDLLAAIAELAAV